MYVLKYSRTIFYFFLRRKTAMEIQKGIATVLCIYIDYIHILNECQHRQSFNILTAPIHFFCSCIGFIIKNIPFHIYRASRIIAV